MELNKEQIIKALECCTYGGDVTKSQVEVCSPCPYFNEGNCTDILKENALSLIKELTEESKKWEQAYDCMDSACRELSSKCDELTEENESLKTQRRVLAVGLKDMRKEIRGIKADTVRKMHSEIKDRCIKGGIYPAFVKSTIDQIAKEMLEGEK